MPVSIDLIMLWTALLVCLTSLYFIVRSMYNNLYRPLRKDDDLRKGCIGLIMVFVLLTVVGIRV